MSRPIILRKLFVETMSEYDKVIQRVAGRATLRYFRAQLAVAHCKLLPERFKLFLFGCDYILKRLDSSDARPYRGHVPLPKVAGKNKN